jgi:hypothetical protein
MAPQVSRDRDDMPATPRGDPHRISSRSTEDALIAERLAPAGRIPFRSALIARAATRRIPLDLSDPDTALVIAYRELTEFLDGVNAR